MKPHPAPSHEKAEQLTARVRETMERIVPKGSQDPRSYLTDIGQELFYTVVARASEFFAYCPEDFCIQSSHISGSTLVFGGTNRLLWNVVYGFRPDPSYCTPKFKEQFTGEYYEVVARLHMAVPQLSIVTPEAQDRPCPQDARRSVTIPMARDGIITIQGRQSRKGDGKIAEVVFFTGVEA